MRVTATLFDCLFLFVSQIQVSHETIIFSYKTIDKIIVQKQVHCVLLNPLLTAFLVVLFLRHKLCCHGPTGTSRHRHYCWQFASRTCQFDCQVSKKIYSNININLHFPNKRILLFIDQLYNVPILKNCNDYSKFIAIILLIKKEHKKS